MKLTRNYKSRPKIGDRRIVMKFAWIPVWRKDEGIWFQDYWIEQEYTLDWDYGGYWENTHFAFDLYELMLLENDELEHIKNNLR